LVLERPVAVDNPFIHMTKTQVLSELARHRQQSLITYTYSCAHQGYGQTQLSLHFGTCSQCIDRRLAVLAAGVQEHDPERDYRTNVFCGPRDEGYEQNMAVNYVRHATALNQMTPDQITATFNMELSRVVRFAKSSREEATRFIEMYEAREGRLRSPR
jgi:hypothetical protein